MANSLHGRGETFQNNFIEAISRHSHTQFAPCSIHENGPVEGLSVEKFIGKHHAEPG